ncbi:LuxR family transcriptional regulator [Streptomyces sp. YS415]|uniref:helix-turn-helix transcriptional regulator n=1 Tax=Streptomyces sp. YS415 TaxID=2944806 RepID=UPI00202233AA|nr:LuxR family transcriptional regulator [Streptomyces sp. YS415]MCL7429148.1 AAA family ATPase [Streptomyces sp. YS415]
MPGSVEGTLAAAETELVGRDAAWTALRDAIVAAPRGGRAFWLCGEAGMGKTALLEQAVVFAEASGMRVIKMTGTEQDSDLAFGVLHRLISAHLNHDNALTSPQRQALQTALGTGQGAAGGGLAASAATLALLSKAAEEQPLLLVVDDLQWVDASSAEILAFVQRRLGMIPVVLAAAVRTPGSPALDSTGAHLLDLPPLTEDEAVEVLNRRHPELTAQTRDHLVREAAGNPLALVELPAHPDRLYSTEQLPLPEDLPLGSRLEKLYGTRLQALSPPARDLLLLCALAGQGERSIGLALEATAVAGTSTSAAVLESAENAGLIRLHHGRMSFVHPLVRTCLIRIAPPAERRRAHLALAAALPPDDERRLTHLAAATVGANDELACRLQNFAERALRRGAHPEAATFLAHAARLSSDRTTGAKRLTTAAYIASTAGQLAVAARLLMEAEAAGVPAENRTMWNFTHAYLRCQREGDLSPAAELLPAELGTLHGADPVLRDGVRFLVHLAATCLNEQHLWEALREQLHHLGSVARLCFDVWSDPARRGRGGAKRLHALVAALPPEQEMLYAWELLWIAAALDCVGDLTQLWHRVAQQSPHLTQTYIGIATCMDDWLRGRWDHCLATAREGERTARERGCGFHAYVFHHTLGYVHAGRGERDALEAVIESIEPWAREHRQSHLLRRMTSMRASCALTLGEDETAFALTASLTPPGTFPAMEPHFHYVFLDLVESAVRTGRRAEALAHVAAGRHARMEEIAPHHAFVLAAATAMAADDAEVDAASHAVYAMPDAGTWPFELARVHLHHGAWLRRGHRLEEARRQLRLAHAYFSDLEAGPWVRRAAEELRAGGSAIAHANPPEEWRLTPQELRIAGLVASGLTNGQIAERLNVSPRTIGTHLYKIFPKVNVSSRSALAHAVRSVGGQGVPGGPSRALPGG